MLKLTADRILEALPVITEILRSNRPMPQRGKMLFAMAHTALLPKYHTLEAQRAEIAKPYTIPATAKRIAEPEDGEEAMKLGYVEEETGYTVVPADKAEAFLEAWKLLGAEEFEVDVKQIPFKAFDLGTGTDGSILGTEIISMGELITE